MRDDDNLKQGNNDGFKDICLKLEGLTDGLSEWK